MVTRVITAPSSERVSNYERAWSGVALVAAAVFVAIAVIHAPSVTLLCLVMPLALLGGTLFLRDPWSSRSGQHQYGVGVGVVAGAVLVAVGIGHDFTAGLTVLGLLGSSSPWTLRWVSGG